MSVDFLILAVLEQEVAAVLHAADHYGALRATSPSPTTYRISLYSKSPRIDQTSTEGILVAVSDIGRVQAAVSASLAIQAWQPECVILVGVAGGFQSNNVALGDVIVPDKILDYERQKLRTTAIEPRWQTYEVDRELLTIAKFVAQTFQFSPLKALHRDRPEWSGPKVRFGPIISGDKIIASTDVVNSFLEAEPGLIGVDMEASGVALATQIAAQSNPARFLTIRGVADAADEGKADDSAAWLSFACKASAMFAVAVLKAWKEPNL